MKEWDALVALAVCCAVVLCFLIYSIKQNLNQAYEHGYIWRPDWNDGKCVECYGPACAECK